MDPAYILLSAPSKRPDHQIPSFLQPGSCIPHPPSPLKPLAPSLLSGNISVATISIGRGSEDRTKASSSGQIFRQMRGMERLGTSSLEFISFHSVSLYSWFLFVFLVSQHHNGSLWLWVNWLPVFSNNFWVVKHELPTYPPR